MREDLALPLELLDIVISFLNKRDQISFLLSSTTFDLAVGHIYQRIGCREVLYLESRHTSASERLSEQGSGSRESSDLTVEMTRLTAYLNAVRFVHWRPHETSIDYDYGQIQQPWSRPAPYPWAEGLLPNIRLVWISIGRPDRVLAVFCQDPAGRLIDLALSHSDVLSPFPWPLGAREFLEDVLARADTTTKVSLGCHKHLRDTTSQWDIPRPLFISEESVPREIVPIAQAKRIRLDDCIVDLSRLSEISKAFPALDELGIYVTEAKHRSNGSQSVSLGSQFYPIDPTSGAVDESSLDVKPSLDHGEVGIPSTLPKQSSGLDLISGLRILALISDEPEVLDSAMGHELPKLELLQIRTRWDVLKASHVEWSVPRLRETVVHVDESFMPEVQTFLNWISPRIPITCVIRFSANRHAYPEAWIARFHELRLAEREKIRGPPGFSLVPRALDPPLEVVPAPEHGHD